MKRLLVTFMAGLSLTLSDAAQQASLQPLMRCRASLLQKIEAVDHQVSSNRRVAATCRRAAEGTPDSKPGPSRAPTRPAA